MTFKLSIPTNVQGEFQGLLTPSNDTLILVDHQPQMPFATRSIDVAELRNNCSIISKAASTLRSVS